MSTTKRNRKKTKNDFKCLTIFLPQEWKEEFQETFKTWSIKEINNGRKPFLTNFFKEICREYLDKSKYNAQVENEIRQFKSKYTKLQE